MTMKRYFTLPKFPEQEPHQQIQFIVLPRKPLFCEGGSYYSQHILSPSYKVYIIPEAFNQIHYIKLRMPAI